jgi:hypothetical protein
MASRKQRGGRNPFAKIDPPREKRRLFSIDGAMSLNIFVVLLLAMILGPAAGFNPS